MKALSIRQPWAWAIVSGFKHVENRTWRTHYRGPLAVHAGMRRADEAAVAFLRSLDIPVPDDLDYGALIGTAELIDVLEPHQLDAHPLVEGPWCWHLIGATPVRVPIPWRGQLSLFELPSIAIRRLRLTL